MVKNCFFILSFCIFLFSCSNSQSSSSNDVDIYEYNDSINIIPSPKHKMELPEGMEYGKIIPPEFPDSMKAERNLLVQVAAYNSALLHGDVQSCAKYLYPDAFEYCRKYYPDFPDEEVMKEFFKDVSGEMKDMVAAWQRHGVDIQIVVCDFLRKVTYKDDIIIVFNISTNFYSEEVYTHSTQIDKTIGISQNGGKNWWFMDDHEDLPTILSMHYNQDVVNAVMGY